MHERDLLFAAIEIDDPTARREYLDEACAGNVALRDRVERLLSRATQTADFLEQPHNNLCSDLAAELLADAIEPRASSPQDGMPDAAAEVGKTLFGRYRVERELGSGGMGVVYLAEDIRLGRRVALKIPRFDADGELRLTERFRREARTMASVQHRNLCPIFDVDEQAGTHYLTMSFIDGEPLSQIIQRGMSFTARQIAQLIRKLARGLEAAHRAGVVHRDLKPANVMIDRDGEPILMDFGLAWLAHEADARVTQSGAIIGTPAYMSPEQAEGDPDKVGPASDIYSLGAILYELLTGRPLRTGNVQQTLFKLMHEAPARPSEIRGDVDPRLEEICCKAISLRPEDRFASSAEFAEALAGFNLADKTSVLSASSSTIVDPARQDTSWSKPRLALVSLLLVAALGVVWTIAANRTKPFGDNVVQPRPQPPTDDSKVIVSDVVPLTNDRYVAVEPQHAMAPFDANEAQAHQAAWAKHLGVPVEYTNSIGMKFVLIPPGEFTMGSPPAEIEEHLQEVSEIEGDGSYVNKQWRERIESAVPHKVVLTQPFFLGIDEVTQQQYETVMGTNPSHFSITGAGKEEVANLDTKNHPVDLVSWNDAVEFCVKLSQTEKLKPFYFHIGQAVMPLIGNGYRLPSEAEWEFACRAGTITRFWNGDSSENHIVVAWSSHSSGGRTHPVGELEPNPFGLFDVHGNVHEWVDDAWDPAYYQQFSKKTAINPICRKFVFPHVIRGGCWGDPVIFCRASLRHAYHSLDKFTGLGFRVALTAEAVKQAQTPKAPLDDAQTKNGTQRGSGDLTPVRKVDRAAKAPAIATEAGDCSVRCERGDGSSSGVGQTLGRARRVCKLPEDEVRAHPAG